MFGLFTKLSEYVWGASEDENGDTSKTGARNKTADYNGKLKTTEPQLKKDLFGKVTRLYDGSGVIDEEIYFTFDCIIGGDRPEVGMEVHVEASRVSETSGWKATRMQVMKEWNLEDANSASSSSTETCIGAITKIAHDSGVVDNEIHFPLSRVSFGYTPFQGDMVKLDLEKSSDGQDEVQGVMPLREKSFKGTVTYVSSGFGYVDEEVFFTIGVCPRGFRPRRGDVVKVTAIESHQRNAAWRAIKVEPRRAAPMVSSPSPHSQMFMGNRIAELLRDKEGLTISDQLDFGSVMVGETKLLHVWISNKGDKVQTFQSCSSIRDDPQFSVQLADKICCKSDDNGSHQQNRSLSIDEMLLHSSLLAPGMEINPQQAKQVIVEFRAKTLGRVNHLFVFNFGGFEIGRYVACNVQDPNQDVLKPSAPYQRSHQRTKEAWKKVANSSTGEEWIIPGEKPIRKSKIFLPKKLLQYNIPRDIRRCLLDGEDLSSTVTALREPVNLKNYAARFSTLLYAEELQMEIDMREFDMEGVNMNVCGEFLSLNVPGLAEGRPSLLIGDKILASLTGVSSESPKYEGYIHEVHKDEILVKFNEDFHNRFAMQKCDVMFYFNRTTLRRAHRAVEFAVSLGEQVLFPRNLSPKLPVLTLTLPISSPKGRNTDIEKDSLTRTQSESAKELKPADVLYNPSLNERQMAAVNRIVSGQCRPTPYLLFGPPGTGKTITVVEAILQIFHRIPSSRVLACAPSNSASDLIAERLHMSGYIQAGDMVRLNAAQRVQNIPESISPYCIDTDQLEMASRYRIIVSTCSTAGQLYSLGLRPGHITHVFIDEAGQATEPECLVALGLAAGEDGQIILAGDPFQLGPVLQSRVAAAYGLNISLLERLMNRPLYCRDEDKFVDHGCYDPLLVTKLVNNYRSHPAVLKLPSAVFYHDELQPCADVNMRESLNHWEKLPRKGFPVLFHGLKGEDLREGNSPSWFNPVEAVQVVKYLQSLRSNNNFPLKLTDIGVITPYRKQVEKLRLLLDRLGLGEVKVGSVEEFQGQERLAIVISTVRSNESMVGVDVRHSVGFLSNPKRFNVAITRAQALLVVVGNPYVLCQDPYWCCLLQYCVMNDAYVGCDLPSLEQQFLTEEFYAAANLLNRTLAANEKSPENANSARPQELMQSSISEKETNVTILQCSDAFANCANTQANSMKEKGEDSSDFLSTSFSRESTKQPHNACGTSPLQRTNQTPSKENNSTKSAHDEASLYMWPVGVEHEVHTNTGMAPEFLTKEQDLEDDLEEFVLQPRNNKH